MERVFAYCFDDLLNFEVCVHEQNPTLRNLKVAYAIEGKIQSLLISEGLFVHILTKKGICYFYQQF